MSKRKIVRIEWLLHYGVIFVLIALLFLIGTSKSSAQNCTGNVPSYTINMTGKADSVWTSPSVSRNGQCCSVSTSNNCILFVVTLDSNAIGLKVEIVGGGSGATYYHINCTDSGLLGSPKCVTGKGALYITICKPGTNLQNYRISSLPKGYVSKKSVYLTPNCRARLQVNGLLPSSITWTAITSSTYNANLSCTSGCDTTSVKYTSGFPSYVDYKVCGTPINSCAGSSFCDTIRVYLRSNLSVSINQTSPKVCYGATTTTLSATASGGQSAYTYKWSNGTTGQSISVPTGSYYVTVSDQTSCTASSSTVVVSTYPRFAANAGIDTTVCASSNAVNLHGSVSGVTTGRWSGGTGKFIPNDSSLSSVYVPSSPEVSAGRATLYLTPTNTHGCTYFRDTLVVTIRPMPNPVISGSMQVCENSTNKIYSVTNNAGSSYLWVVLGGTITSGQNSNSITVSWGSAGPGFVYVTETNNYGCTATAGISPVEVFDFNTSDLTYARKGSNASSVDADAYSIGSGPVIGANCSATKGLNLNVSSSALDRGRLSIQLIYQRDEADGTLFERGGMKMYLSSGSLYMNYRISTGSTGYTDIGPVNTGYIVPNDDILRTYIFSYDSTSGKATLHVDGSQVWSNTTTAGRSLYWTGAGNAVIGGSIDGGCGSKAIFDMAAINVPVSIQPNPNPVIIGNTAPCEHEGDSYSVTSQTGHSYSWSSSGGTISSGAGTNSITISWGNAGSGSITITDTNTVTGCVKTTVQSITINSKPSPVNINHN